MNVVEPGAFADRTDPAVRGAAVEPLYRSVPQAARLDSALYELLALVDAIRIGRARARKLAESMLRSRLQAAG